MANMAPGQEGRCCSHPKSSGVRRGQLYAGPRIVFQKWNAPYVTCQIVTPISELRSKETLKLHISFSPVVGDRLSLIRDQ